MLLYASSDFKMPDLQSLENPEYAAYGALAALKPMEQSKHRIEAGGVLRMMVRSS